MSLHDFHLFLNAFLTLNLILRGRIFATNKYSRNTINNETKRFPFSFPVNHFPIQPTLRRPNFSVSLTRKHFPLLFIEGAECIKKSFNGNVRNTLHSNPRSHISAYPKIKLAGVINSPRFIQRAKLNYIKRPAIIYSTYYTNLILKIDKTYSMIETPKPDSSS